MKAIIITSAISFIIGIIAYHFQDAKEHQENEDDSSSLPPLDEESSNYITTTYQPDSHEL